jgi:putative ABC transport system permease protein
MYHRGVSFGHVPPVPGKRQAGDAIRVTTRGPVQSPPYPAQTPLGILAMSAGLLRSELASDLRVLTAAGAGSTARRAISAATAGALALIGAVVGTVAGYIAAIGFYRTSRLDSLWSLTSVPVTSLLLILVGMPIVAVIGGRLLAGREPTAIGRRPLE